MEIYDEGLKSKLMEFQVFRDAQKSPNAPTIYDVSFFNSTLKEAKHQERQTRSKKLYNTRILQRREHIRSEYQSLHKVRNSISFVNMLSKISSANQTLANIST